MIYYREVILNSKEKLIKKRSVSNRFSTLVEYNEKSQAVLLLALKLVEICIFLPKTGFERTFSNGESREESCCPVSFHLPTFCQVFQRVI